VVSNLSFSRGARSGVCFDDDAQRVARKKTNKSAEVLFGYVGGNTDVSILKQDITKANEVQKKLNGWLLDPRDTVDLVTYVETISDKVGLNPTIENLNAQKTVSIGDGESSALELVVQMEGSFWKRYSNS